MVARESYSVGWICARPEVSAAAIAQLDILHNSLPQLPQDNNSYSLGRIADRNVVIVVLPYEGSGGASTAVVAMDMHRTFPQSKVCLTICVGSGFPGREKDIRLGDVVDWSSPTSEQLLSVVGGLRRKYRQMGHGISKYHTEMMHKYPKMRKRYSYPSEESDPVPDDACVRRVRTTQDPVIHYGLIGSGDQLIGDKTTRDRLVEKVPDIVGLGREGAGCITAFPGSFHIVQGVCNYGDSQDATSWIPYAAATAAAYAKELTMALSDAKEITGGDHSGRVYESFEAATVVELQGQTEPKWEASLAIRDTDADADWEFI